jgi:hypothetical protein
MMVYSSDMPLCVDIGRCQRGDSERAFTDLRYVLECFNCGTVFIDILEENEVMVVLRGEFGGFGKFLFSAFDPY